MPSQSAPTILVDQVDLIFFQGLKVKKKKVKIWVAENRVIVIQKEKRQPGLQTFFLEKHFVITHIRENIRLGAKFEGNL